MAAIVFAALLLLGACTPSNSNNNRRDHEFVDGAAFRVLLQEAGLPVEHLDVEDIQIVRADVLFGYANDLFDIHAITDAWGGRHVGYTFGWFAENNDNLNNDASITRAQATHFVNGVREVKDRRASSLTAFYAIASFDQIHMIDALDVVSMGWSRFDIIDGEAVFNLSVQNDNEYSIPLGYALPMERARANNVPVYLMVAGNMAHHGGMTTAAYIVRDPTMRESALNDLVDAAENGVISPVSGQRIFFDGITMDFEEMRGAETREAYSQFIIDLRTRLPEGFGLLICVHPAVGRGMPFFDAFDFRVLGEHSDGLIVMAHDYYAKSLSEEELLLGEVATRTPPSPIADVYYAIYAATHSETGTDPANVWLAMSFTGVQWQMRDGVVQNRIPLRPTNDAIERRLPHATVTHGASGNPRAVWTYNDLENVMFFEDAVSTMQRQRLADMFGLAGLSLWRLGNVPDGSADVDMDAWDRLLAHRDR